MKRREYDAVRARFSGETAGDAEQLPRMPMYSSRPRSRPALNPGLTRCPQAGELARETVGVIIVRCAKGLPTGELARDTAGVGTCAKKLFTGELARDTAGVGGRGTKALFTGELARDTAGVGRGTKACSAGVGRGTKACSAGVQARVLSTEAWASRAAKSTVAGLESDLSNEEAIDCRGAHVTSWPGSCSGDSSWL